MNPLSIPWGAQDKPVARSPVPNFIGLRNEVARQNQNLARRITIELQGLAGRPNGRYDLEYSAGASLRHYFHQLKLQHAAAHSSVRDLTNPEAGRLRSSYVPAENSHIVLGNPKVSSMLHLQRTNHDAQSIAARMGTAKIVERKMR